MIQLIEIVPALKRLELSHVGCWEDLKMEFIPNLNIITEEGSAWGKTTIFRAILQSLRDSLTETPLFPTNGFEKGAICVEFVSVIRNIELRSHHDDTSRRSTGELSSVSSLRQLRSSLKAAKQTTALLISDGVTAALDLLHYAEAIKLLNTSHCQVICQVAHRCELSSFPEARIFTIYMDEEGKARMKFQDMRSRQDS